eukprot:TRINITY_DN16582_c0_g1_i1.p1 TRINITY_DN16582_c0_g1~~TRINITY_DN16582_c0_g1_i1.p1  ORF type:complete len:284 (+),score=98.88 TRINITY_DN16582_c0_g1_i1:51-902(+)
MACWVRRAGRRWCSSNLPAADVPVGEGSGSEMAGWNPVKRSGFRPMSKEKMKAMIARLKEERMELGERQDWTQADWEEAKAEGLDTERRASKLGSMFKKELERASELRGEVKYTFSDVDPDVGKVQADSDPSAEPSEDEKIEDLVQYFATRMVWEVEEMYRNRVGTAGGTTFLNKPPEDTTAHDYDYGQADDPRFLQAKYIRFKRVELPFWHKHHRRIIQATAALFQRKLWRVRDIAYCDDMCLVFVDNRHQPHYYRAVSDKKRSAFNTVWGAPGPSKSKGSF